MRPGPRRGNVLDPRGLHPPPDGVEELEERPDGLGELRVVAVLVRLLRVPGEVDRLQEPRQVRPAQALAARRTGAGRGPRAGRPLPGAARAASRAPRELVLEVAEPLAQAIGLRRPRSRTRGSDAPARRDRRRPASRGTTLARLHDTASAGSAHPRRVAIVQVGEERLAAAVARAEARAPARPSRRRARNG